MRAHARRRRGEIVRGHLAAWLLAFSATAHASDVVRPAATAASSALTHPWAQAIQSRAAKSRVEALQGLYGPGGYATVWLDTAGRPTPSVAEALAVLGASATEGLDPADYGTDELSAQVAELRFRTPDAQEAADFELRISAAMLRYLRDLHVGRVDPHSLGYQVVRRPEPDDGATLRSALLDGRLQDMATGMAPIYTQYRQLRAALARYRTLAADPAWPRLPALGRTLKPGEGHPALVALRQRLLALGDMPGSAQQAASAPGFDAALVEGVKRFQRRHGLQADGAIGRATEKALQVPLARRVRQIELAMERMRWLAPLDDRPVVTINIPMFRLWAYSARNRTAPHDMAVIVGRSLRTRTPVLMDDLRQVIFRPYWNVPRSIVSEEILPRLRRDPGYLDRNEMEIVRGGGDDATRVAATPANLELLAQGDLRLRQRPGPRNSLGLVKFVFPNDDNIYLHGTPATELFQQARRDFSHGCVRVEDTVWLAQWLLSGQPEWTRERIVEAMNGTKSVQVNVTTPVQVLIYYLTAVVLPGNGELAFAEDIYGHDKALESALANRSARPPRSG